MRPQLNNMLQLLLFTLLASAAVAKEAEPVKTAAEPVAVETQASESAEKNMMKDAESAPFHLYDEYEHRDRLHHHDGDHLYLKAKLDGPHGPREGPLIARNLHPSRRGANIAEQDEIIKFTYSPAFYEPIWVLDYRFLKSGGRRYTRGPGGQVLILPKSYKHYKGDGTGDYDALVEYWRLRLIAEQKKRSHEHRFGRVHDHLHDHGHQEEYGHGEHMDEEIHMGHDINLGREYREREPHGY